MALIRNPPCQYLPQHHIIAHRAPAGLAEFGIFTQIAERKISEAAIKSCYANVYDALLNADTAGLFLSAALENPA